MPLSELVGDFGQSLLEADQVHTAFLSVYVVDVAEDIFLISVGVLHGDFDNSIIFAPVEIYWRGINGNLFAV